MQRQLVREVRLYQGALGGQGDQGCHPDLTRTKTPKSPAPSHRPRRIFQSPSQVPPPSGTSPSLTSHEVLCCPIKGSSTWTVPPPAQGTLEGKVRFESSLSINGGAQMVEARLGQVGGTRMGPVTDSPRGQKRRRSHQSLGHQGPQGAEGPGHGTSHSGLPHPAEQRRVTVRRTMRGPHQAWTAPGPRGPFPCLTPPASS